MIKKKRLGIGSPMGFNTSILELERRSNKKDEDDKNADNLY